MELKEKFVNIGAGYGIMLVYTVIMGSFLKFLYNIGAVVGNPAELIAQFSFY